MNDIQKLLENECSPFINTMAASSTLINKKVDVVNNLIKQWEDSDRAAEIAERKKQEESNKIANQTNQNSLNSQDKKSSKKNKLKRAKEMIENPNQFVPRSALEVLTMAGIKSSDLNKIKKVMSEAKKISDIANNYGKESNADFLSKVANVQTFLNHKGLSNAPSGCDIMSSVFKVSMGLGKALLGAINSTVGGISGMMSKIGGWLEQGLAYGQAIASKIMSTFNDITGMIDSALQTVMDLANQLTQAIQEELNAFKEMLEYNARMALGALLGDMLGDQCIKGLVGSIGNSAMRKLF